MREVIVRQGPTRDQDKEKLKHNIYIINILINKAMKKYFFYATAAIVMLAGCNKNNPTEQMPPVEGNENPVAMSLNAKAPATVETKAAVEAWNDTEIYAFAIRSDKAEDGTVTKTPVFEEKLLVVAADGSIDLKNDEDLPYYYAETATYDFYAYYKGTAAFTEVQGTDIAYTVEFDGSQDVMYASAMKDVDVFKADPADQVTVADLYSAWAARRGVQPTLVFNHALTRFNFNIIGADATADDVRIDSVRIQSKNTGVLTVVGNTPGLAVEAPAVTDDWLSLKDANDQDVTGTGLQYAVTYADTDDDLLPNCLMVAPGMTVVNAEVYMSKKETTGVYTELEPYKFSLDITKDVKLAEGAPTDKFAAGYAYDINVMVYGPMMIEISAELTPWLPGGEGEYDPDTESRPNDDENAGDATLTNTSISYVDGQAAYDAIYGGTGAPTWDEANASGTLPWLVAKFDAITPGTQLTVQVKYDGALVELTPKFQNWPAGTRVVGKTTLVTTPASAVTTMGFEVKDELGLDAATVDFSKFEMLIGYNGVVNVFKF